jgi:hypothetical protein
LARGWGWQFYLLASFIHGLANYSVILLQNGLFTGTITEIYIAVIAAAVFGVVMWLRWRKPAPEAEIGAS